MAKIIRNIVKGEILYSKIFILFKKILYIATDLVEHERTAIDFIR
jgi:hypothetical protein